MAGGETERQWNLEMQRLKWDLREKAIQGFANDGALSDEDVEFYRIVLRLTDGTG